VGVASLHKTPAHGPSHVPVNGGSLSISEERAPESNESKAPPSGDLTPVTEQRASEINEMLKDKTADEVLRWFADAMPGHVVQLSSFGPSGLVLLDKMSAMGLLGKISTVMIDTLHLFPETHAHVQNVSRMYPQMQLHVYYPHGFRSGEKEGFDKKYGARLWAEDYSRYAYLSKVEPTAHALEELRVQAWITGRRRSQGVERKDLPVVEWDDGRLKVNPLVNWTFEQVWQYLRSHHVPYNSLHDRGYTSIGDVMTTRPVVKGEPERAGRFDGNRTECGMHSHNKRIEAMREEAREHGVPFEIPTLKCDICQEVRPGNFWEVVLDTRRDLLMEFYSPFCGHCHAMAPKYEQVAKRLREMAPQVAVARMDIISHEIPPPGIDAGFQLGAYPTIFLVRPGGDSGKLQLKQYEGPHTAQSLLDWLKSELPYLPRDL